MCLLLFRRTTPCCSGCRLHRRGNDRCGTNVAGSRTPSIHTAPCLCASVSTMRFLLIPPPYISPAPLIYTTSPSRPADRAQYHNEVSKRRQQLQHEARREAQVDRVAAVDADRADRSYAEYERARQRQSRELSRRCMEYNRTALHKKHATKPLPDPQVYAAQSDAFFGKFGTSLR